MKTAALAGIAIILFVAACGRDDDARPAISAAECEYLIDVHTIQAAVFGPELQVLLDELVADRSLLADDGWRADVENQRAIQRTSSDQLSGLTPPPSMLDIQGVYLAWLAKFNEAEELYVSALLEPTPAIDQVEQALRIYAEGIDRLSEALRVETEILERRSGDCPGLGSFALPTPS